MNGEFSSGVVLAINLSPVHQFSKPAEKHSSFSQVRGRGRPAQGIERISLIRDAIGPDTNLMVDINQRWGVYEAIFIGRRVEEFGLGWLEDPRCDDYQGLSQNCRCFDDADLRRRISLWHRAPPADDDASFGRHRHDRFGSRRRRHPMDEGVRHGGGHSQACSEPSPIRNSFRHRRAEWTGGRVQAMNLAFVRQSIHSGKRR